MADLGPTAAPGRRRVHHGDDPDGPVACRREIGDRADPGRVGGDPVGDPGVLVEHALPRRDVRRHHRSRAVATERHDHRIDRPRLAGHGRELLGGRRETPSRVASMVTHSTPRDVSAFVIAVPDAGTSVTTTARVACAAELALGRRLVERRAETGVPAAVAGLRCLGGREHGGAEQLQQPRAAIRRRWCAPPRGAGAGPPTRPPRRSRT